MNLTWGQMAMAEYVVKNPTARETMIVERRWSGGKVPAGTVAQLIQTVLGRHDALWSQIEVSNINTQRMSETRLTQNLAETRVVEISRAEAEDTESIRSWRENGPRIWKSKDDSPGQCAIIGFPPRVLILTNSDGSTDILVRLPHTSIDAASFRDLHSDFLDFLAGRRSRPAMSLNDQLERQASPLMNKLNQRSSAYLKEALMSAADSYLLCPPDVLSAPAVRVEEGLHYEQTERAVQSTNLSASQIWLGALVAAVSDVLGSAGALFKSHATIRTGIGDQLLIGPITRSALIRVDLNSAVDLRGQLDLVTNAATRGFRHINYNPLHLWIAEEKRSETVGHPLRGQVLFNIAVNRSDPRITVGETRSIDDPHMSFDQRLFINVNIHPMQGVVSLSITSRESSSGPSISQLSEIIKEKVSTMGTHLATIA